MKAFYKRIILFAVALQSITFCIGQTLTKTVVKDEDNKPIEYKYLDSELNTRMIENLNEKGAVVCTVWYNEKGQLVKLKTAGFTRDYSDNTYFDKATNTELDYASDRLSGSQSSNGIIVNYLNGEKNGILIQADSAITGTKLYGYQRADIVALQRNRIEWITEVKGEPTFTLFNGYYLKFKDGQLDGKQRAFYFNGKIKFVANFEMGKPIDYVRYDKDGSIVSKIKFKNGITDGKYILNGVVYADTCIMYFKELDNAGNIISVYPKNKEEYYDAQTEKYYQIENDNSQDGDNDNYKWENHYKINRLAITKFETEKYDEDAVLRIPYPLDTARVEVKVAPDCYKDCQWIAFSGIYSGVSEFGQERGNIMSIIAGRKNKELDKISKIYGLGKIIKASDVSGYDQCTGRIEYPKYINYKRWEGSNETYRQSYFIYEPSAYVVKEEKEPVFSSRSKHFIKASSDNPVHIYADYSESAKILLTLDKDTEISVGKEAKKSCGGFFVSIQLLNVDKQFPYWIALWVKAKNIRELDKAIAYNIARTNDSTRERRLTALIMMSRGKEADFETVLNIYESAPLSADKLSFSEEKLGMISTFSEYLSALKNDEKVKKGIAALMLDRNQLSSHYRTLTDKLFKGALQSVRNAKRKAGNNAVADYIDNEIESIR